MPKTAHGARATGDIKLVSTLPKNTGVSASTATVEQRNNFAAFLVTSHSSLYQVQIIGHHSPQSPRLFCEDYRQHRAVHQRQLVRQSFVLAETAAFEAASCDSGVV
jgi:hypothetical protein